MFRSLMRSPNSSHLSARHHPAPAAAFISYEPPDLATPRSIPPQLCPRKENHRRISSRPMQLHATLRLQTRQRQQVRLRAPRERRHAHLRQKTLFVGSLSKLSAREMEKMIRSLLSLASSHQPRLSRQSVPLKNTTLHVSPNFSKVLAIHWTLTERSYIHK